jgi:integration host factor subunit alpha
MWRSYGWHQTEDRMSTKTLTRADLAETLHRDIGLSRAESADMVNNVLDLVSDALVDGQSVKLSSFGTFMVRAKRERMGRNPKTGEEVPITPRRVLVFRPSQVMKNVINGLEPGDKD